MKTQCIILAMMPMCAFAIGRNNQLIDDNWQFELYADSAAQVPAITKTVDLPHDWSVELPFGRMAPAGNDGAYLPCGKARYTRSLEISKNDLRGRCHKLLFEGIYERATVIVNDDTVGFRPYGYSSVVYDITPYVHADTNTITVDVDNSNQKNSRWYTGSGIYRHVRHITTDSVHISPWSLYISTPETGLVNVSFEIANFDKAKASDVHINILDAEGQSVASLIRPLEEAKAQYSISLDNPHLWDVDTPYLYTLQISLKDADGMLTDAETQKFGIRTISYSATDGMRLNGRRILINGACVHHDNGMLGAASYDAAEARKVKLLKDAGFNAVRTSHNPPSPAFLDECDRQGLLVIDEAFDGWRDRKNDHDYHLWIDRWGCRDLADMVRRDRNHPAIIAWSIGNEVIERKHIGVVTTARTLADVCRRLDPTRPVTEALCAWDSDWEIYDPHAEALDIVGYNYMIHKSDTDHARCPQRIMWQTESYPAEAASNWHKITENPYIVGDFVWTGIDYLGESGIGRFYYKGQTEGEHYERDQWPWHGAYCGDIDLTGWRKPISHYRDMLYNRTPGVYLAVCEPSGYHGDIRLTKWGNWPTWESWNWPGHEGKPIEVCVLSTHPQIQLWLNDSLVAQEQTHDCMAICRIPYQAGRLKAVAIDNNGQAVADTMLETASKAAALRITADRASLDADNQDLAFIIIEVVDNDGRNVPDAIVPLHIEVSGKASLKACGNADLTDTTPYTMPHTQTYKGRAMAVVKSTYKKGNATVTVTAPGMKAQKLKLTCK